MLSAGRLLLGIGAGYLEPEMTAIGVPMADRGTRTDDHLAAMRALWTQPGPVDHHGPFVDFFGMEKRTHNQSRQAVLASWWAATPPPPTAEPSPPATAGTASVSRRI